MPNAKYDYVGAMMLFEDGELTDEADVVELFQYLVTTGLAWSLPGSYGRAASQLIRQGYVTIP